MDVSKLSVTLPAMSMPNFARESMQGFESPMSKKEAKSILNIRDMNPTKDSIREAHIRLLVSNHPDRGGSTYIASKINEAKDVMLGKKTSQVSVSKCCSARSIFWCVAFA